MDTIFFFSKMIRESAQYKSRKSTLRLELLNQGTKFIFVDNIESINCSYFLDLDSGKRKKKKRTTILTSIL